MAHSTSTVGDKLDKPEDPVVLDESEKGKDKLDKGAIDLTTSSMPARHDDMVMHMENVNNASNIVDEVLRQDVEDDHHNQLDENVSLIHHPPPLQSSDDPSSCSLPRASQVEHTPKTHDKGETSIEIDSPAQTIENVDKSVDHQTITVNIEHDFENNINEDIEQTDPVVFSTIEADAQDMGDEAQVEQSDAGAGDDEDEGSGEADGADEQAMNDEEVVNDHHLDNNHDGSQALRSQTSTYIPPEN